MFTNKNSTPLIAGTMKWGAWGAKLTSQEYLAMIEQCLECGITTFDHADIYGNYTVEGEFGKALDLNPGLRDRVQLISKCGIRMISPNRTGYNIKHYDTSREHIVESVERSLRNLGTNHLNLLLIHRPDPLMNPDEIAETFTLLQKQGKVLQFGVSNFSVSQMELLHASFPIITNQLEISVLRLQPFIDGTLDHCILKKITPMAWSPLGGGNVFTSTEEQAKRIVGVAEILAEKYASTAPQILLAWLLKHPANIIPVLGTARIARIIEAAEATKITLNKEEWFMLWRASIGEEVE